MDNCIFCERPMLVGEQTARLTQKGCDGILNACKARGTQISVSPGQVVHVKCRSEFTNLRAIECHNKRKLKAAKFIKQDIKNTIQTKDVYPSAEDLSPDKNIEFLPPSLHQLLLILFCGKNTTCKIASIGQAIIQAARPRVLQAPLQFGLGVQMHHLFQSEFLVDSLNRHGFACSYSEFKQFERSASVAQGTELPELSVNNFVQYAGDNVDHNLITLDGTGTFHGMGMIAMVTPGAKLPRKIPRVNVTAEDIAHVGHIDIIAHVGHIDIHQFLSERDTFKTLCFQKIRNPNTKDPSADVDLLWESSLLLNIQRPQWSGLMQLVHKGDTPGASSIMFLPMIDMDPNNLSCIYSALKFISAHARQHSSCPVITFDQPLWWKAHTMVESLPELQPAIIRLGAFHTEMSFLGSIGHLMSGTGLQELLEVVYAGNAVVHMLSGKSVSRAVRGHILVDAALNTMVTSSALGTQLPFSKDNSKPDADFEGGTQQPSALDAESLDVAGEEHGTQLPLSSDTCHPDASFQQASPLDPESHDSAVQDNLLPDLQCLMEGILSGSISPSDVDNSEATANKDGDREREVMQLPCT